MSTDMNVHAALMTVLNRAAMGAQQEAIVAAQRAQEELNIANARVATMTGLVDASRTQAATLEMDIDDLNVLIEQQETYARGLRDQMDALQRELRVERDVANALNTYVMSTGASSPNVHAPTSADVPEDPMQQAITWLVTSKSLHEKLASKDSSVTLSAAELRMLNYELKGAKDRATLFSTSTDNQRRLIAHQQEEAFKVGISFMQELKERVKAERALSLWADDCVDVQNKVAVADGTSSSSSSRTP